jgi:phosphopantothenoylcysteine synthetase/decarboxylase
MYGEETGLHGENHQPVASHSQTLSHNVVSSTPRQILYLMRTHVYYVPLRLSNLERFRIEEQGQMIEKIINSRKSTA